MVESLIVRKGLACNWKKKPGCLQNLMPLLQSTDGVCVCVGRSEMQFLAAVQKRTGEMRVSCESAPWNISRVHFSAFLIKYEQDLNTQSLAGWLNDWRKFTLSPGHCTARGPTLWKISSHTRERQCLNSEIKKKNIDGKKSNDHTRSVINKNTRRKN